MNLKILSITITLILINFSANSAIINVDNNANRPAGYYESLPLALNAANPGDTIYLYPSNTSYGTITINKRIHLFGSGFDGTLGNVSRIDYLTFDTATSPASNPSGSTLMGLTFTYYISCNKSNITNITISGNYFHNTSSSINLGNNTSTWLIYNNLLRGYIDINNNNSIVITNNIFTGNDYRPIRSSSSSSVIISHNLFMRFEYMNTVHNAIIKDNIFVCIGNHNSTHYSMNTFYNNLSWKTTLAPYNLPPEGNTGSGNISNQNPDFESPLASNTDYFDMSKDYRLKSTSPGKNAASDGTDIGPYGGNKPFVWGGTFSIPKITEVNVTNPVINQSTPLNVNVKANNADL